MTWRLDIDESAIYCGDRLVARLETGDSNDDWREATRLGAEMVQSMAVYEALMRDGKKKRSEGEFADPAKPAQTPRRDALSVVADWALAGHITERGVTCEAGDAIRAAVTAEVADMQDTCRTVGVRQEQIIMDQEREIGQLRDVLHRMLEAPTTHIRESWKDAVRQALALGDCRECAVQPCDACPDVPALPPAYMLAKLAMVMPLFQEARDALTALREDQRVLHGISKTLADRMDVAGTYSLDDWKGPNARLTGPKRPPQEYANGTD